MTGLNWFMKKDIRIKRYLLTLFPLSQKEKKPLLFLKNRGVGNE